MFRFSGFTQKANNAINVAMREASGMGHTYIGSEHLILGMLNEESGVAYTVLSEKKVSFDSFRRSIINTVGNGNKTALTPEDFTPRCKKVLEMSMIKARMLGQSYVGTEHILMVIAKEHDSYGIKLLREHGVDTEAMVDHMMDSISMELAESYVAEKYKRQPPVKQGMNTRASAVPGRMPNLEKYSRDLTMQAQMGELDPVIGRNKEIDRVIQILSRRQKNNPCLIGEAGVGKTAIVEGLAQRIVAGAVPEQLLEKRLLTLDLTSMVAGAKYRGDFEERIKRVMEEACENQSVILFIDELHTIIGAGAAEGAIDASNILKPQLARGEIQVLGATTIGEYRKHIEKDSALERRFQSIMVEEPDEETAISILKGLRERYENHHSIRISNDAIEASVKLSVRYISGRYLPDKAIDLIDEASSKLRMKGVVPDCDADELEARLEELKKEKETAVDSQDFELAASIRDREKTLKSRLTTLRGSWQPGGTLERPTLKREDICELVSHITGIEISRLTKEQGEDLIGLESRLHQRVIGQEKAVAAVAGAVRRGRAGLGDPKRPIGSFIFLGPTGVGKTELCLTLAECLYTNRDMLIRVDMSEYMEKHAVSRMIGSPPGYVGFEEGGQLTEKVRQKPYSIILFDEIEKAHPDVFNLLLQILEDGTLTDSQGRKVSFRNTVIIMTSNVGARKITGSKSFGFSPVANDAEASEKETAKQVMEEIKQLMRPELLNRVDEIIVFKKLNKGETCQIARKLLDQLKTRTGEMDISMDFSESVVEYLAEAGFDEAYGARPLRRAMQRHIEDPLAERIIRGEIQSGEKILCNYNGSEIDFVVQSSGVPALGSGQ